jgi:ComF family protein
MSSARLRLLPGQCAVCRSWGYTRLCGACLQRYAPQRARCVRCGLALPSPALVRCGRCALHPPPLDRTVAALDYAFPWRGLLQRFKFHEGLELREALAERMLQAASDAGDAHADLLLPVPLSEHRLRERGYNQSQVLARALARRLRLPCPDGLLLRVRDAARQARLPLAERVANVRGVFAVEPLRRAELQGRAVAVVDDVMTSGATLFEVARVLRAAGASSVQAWVLARTPE